MSNSLPTWASVLDFDALGSLDNLPGILAGSTPVAGQGPKLTVRSPLDGAILATMGTASAEEVKAVAERASAAFRDWRIIPAPHRGELVRRFGDVLREHKQALGELVTLEAGKIPAEAEGEVQEMIDICDFAVGLSRQLHGLTIQSERPMHRLMEQWHPLGPVGVISAFNFPVAVWAWNSTLALVCGDPVIWKPSEKTPLTAMACQLLFEKALQTMPELPRELSFVIQGGRETGEALVRHPALPLISATGSIAMGRKVGAAVAERLGRSLLELGGNNAVIISDSADLELATRACVFAAAGTAGQRCTSLRRLFVQSDIYLEVRDRLKTIYGRLPVGDPREEGTLVGPLVDQASLDKMQSVLAQAKEAGARVHYGEVVTEGVPAGGCYARPALVEDLPADHPLLAEETFAPILYLVPYDRFEEAVAWQNAVPQGLSSAVFTERMREAERFLSPAGSDCGLANVNIGTSGAEIGGAFGGEKETGGGRESGSDAWKNYMRRQTATINYGDSLPLAQGIRFEV